jgi:hypothetical protein
MTKEISLSLSFSVIRENDIGIATPINGQIKQILGSSSF